MSVGVAGLECPEHDVVGDEMGVMDGNDGIVVNTVMPDSVHPDVGKTTCCDGLGRESQHLAFLRIAEIAVSIIEGINLI